MFERLQEFRATIPFLNQVPDEVYFQIDPSEFYFPSGEVAEVRQQLEQELDHFVMTYQRGVFRREVRVERHLCGNLKGADLTPEQLAILNEYEGRFIARGVSFVIYQKPLQLILPSESPILHYFNTV